MGEQDQDGDRETVSRRRAVRALGAMGSGLLAGCGDLLSASGSGGTPTAYETSTAYPTPSPTPSPEPTPSPTATPERTATPTPTETPTPTATPAADPGIVWHDDFESGSLERYAVERVPGDDDTSGYEVVSDPSVGEYAVRHRTESRVIRPAKPVSLSPPIGMTFDLYVEDWSGLDVVLQHDDDSDRTYWVDVRHNANGGFVRVRKTTGEIHTDSTGQKEDTVGKAGPDVIGPNRWERIEIGWTDDALAARARGSGTSVRIEDSDDALRGGSFGLLGYHYSGSATFDNLTIARGRAALPDFVE